MKVWCTLSNSFFFFVCGAFSAATPYIDAWRFLFCYYFKPEIVSNQMNWILTMTQSKMSLIGNIMKLYSSLFIIRFFKSSDINSKMHMICQTLFFSFSSSLTKEMKRFRWVYRKSNGQWKSLPTLYTKEVQHSLWVKNYSYCYIRNNNIYNEIYNY